MTPTGAAPRAAEVPMGQAVLAVEGEAFEVSPAVYAKLASIVTQVRAALPGPIDPADRAQALKAFETIDAVLVRNGFIYPGDNRATYLYQGLTPRRLAADAFATARRHIHNRRRRQVMDANRGGDFFIVDCDLASFIYMEVAAKMGWPMVMVEAPLHNFVRWEFPDGSHLNFETMTGTTIDDASYARDYEIDPAQLKTGFYLGSLSQDEVLGYVLSLRAGEWSRRGRFDRAKTDMERGIRMRPDAPELLNQIAWLYATCTPDDCRDGARAVKLGEELIRLSRTANDLDTLACAYGAAGRFPQAVKVAEEAVGLDPKDGSYRANLRTLTDGRACSIGDSPPAVSNRPNRSRPSRPAVTEGRRNSRD